MFFAPDETAFVEKIERTKAVSVSEVMDFVSKNKERYEPILIKSERDLKVARFGIKFCTRVKFTLGETVLDMGSCYALTNVFFLDYIEDISKASMDPLSMIETDSGLVKSLSEPTAIPVNNSFTGYTFKKDSLNLKKELIGVIFGNTLRKIMNTGEKILYSNDFLTTYTFPYILSPLVADNIFDLGIYKDGEKQLNQFELNQLKRWGHISYLVVK